MSNPVKNEQQPRRSFTPTSPTHPHTPPTPPPRTVSPGYPYAYLNNGSPGGNSSYYNNNNYYNNHPQSQWNTGFNYPQPSPLPPPTHMMQGGPPPQNFGYQPYPPPNYGNNQNYYRPPQFQNQPAYNTNQQFTSPQRGGYHNNNNNNNRPHYQKGLYQSNQSNQNRNGNSNNNRGNFQQNNSFNRNNNTNGGGQSNKAKKKNSFMDKRDLPENNKFYCEVCDRGFKDDEKYQEHCASHETCEVNGCTFTAAAKLVEIHFKNFHATGIDRKVSGLKTPEEIEKYINDRKKNFPTKTNLEKKTDFEKEKSSRGVSLDTQQFNKLGRNKRPNLRGEKPSAGSSLTNESKSAAKNRKKKNNKKGLFQQKIQVLKNRYNKPTLLQRLLADEIRHERNIILQCVRYVVQNNFFDKKI